MPRVPSTLALALAIIGLPAGLRAQQGGEAAGEAADTLRQDTTAQDTLPPPRPAFVYVPPAFSLAVSVGTPGSSPLQTQPVLGRREVFFGTVPDSATIDRTVQATGQLFVGASATLGLSPAWALRLGVGFARGTLETAYDGDDGYSAAASDRAAGPTDIQVLSGESVLRYRIPSGRRLQPFVELGGGVSRWTADAGSGQTAALRSGELRFEGVAGAGAVIPLNSRFSAQIRATTHLFRTPVSPVSAGDTLAYVPGDKAQETLFTARSTLLLTTLAPSGGPFADSGRELASLLRLEVGISFDLGGRAEQPPARVEPSDTTSLPDP